MAEPQATPTPPPSEPLGQRSARVVTLMDKFFNVGNVLLTALLFVFVWMGRNIPPVWTVALGVAALALVVFLSRARSRARRHHGDDSREAARFGRLMIASALVAVTALAASAAAPWLVKLDAADKHAVEVIVTGEQELRGQKTVGPYLKRFAPDAILTQSFPVPNGRTWQGFEPRPGTDGTILDAYNLLTDNHIHYRKDFLREPCYAKDLRMRRVVVATQTQFRQPNVEGWSDMRCEFWVFTQQSPGQWRIQELHGGLTVEEATRRFDAAVGREQ